MSGRLSAAQLAYMQRIATTILDATCDIRRNPDLSGSDPVAGTFGQLLQPEPTSSWTLLSSSIACAFYQAPETPTGMVGSQIGQVATWLLSLPYGTDCREGDRIVSGGAEYQVHTTVLPETYSVIAQFVVGKVE